MTGGKLKDLLEACIDLLLRILPDRKWIHMRVGVSKIERVHLNRNAVVLSSKRIDDFARGMTSSFCKAIPIVRSASCRNRSSRKSFNSRQSSIALKPGC
jgi:hypothetical protein